MKIFLLVISLVALAVCNPASRCADFVFLVGESAEASVNRENKEAVVAVARKFEIETGLQRVALVTGVPGHLHTLNSDQFKTTKRFLEVVRRLHLTSAEDEPDARRSSRSLDEALESVSRSMPNNRRSGVPTVIVLVDVDGSAALSASARTQGIFAKFLKNHLNIHFVIVSKKPERLINALSLNDSAAESVDPGDLQSIQRVLKPFLKCEFLRRAHYPFDILSSAKQQNRNETRRGISHLPEQRVVANGVITGPRRLRRLSSQRSTSTASTTTPRTTTVTQRLYTGRPGCQFDIVMLMDSSTGAADKRERYLEMAVDLASSLEIGEFASQIAFVRYSGRGRADTVFRLKRYRDNATALIEELKAITSLGGTTRTKDAIVHAKHEFAEKFGGREKAQKILIVFTDGYSQDDPSEVTGALKRERIQVYAVAVEDQEVTPNVEQLKAIASEPQLVIVGRAQFAQVKQRFSRCR